MIREPTPTTGRLLRRKQTPSHGGLTRPAKARSSRPSASGGSPPRARGRNGSYPDRGIRSTGPETGRRREAVAVIMLRSSANGGRN